MSVDTVVQGPAGTHFLIFFYPELLRVTVDTVIRDFFVWNLYFPDIFYPELIGDEYWYHGARHRKCFYGIFNFWIFLKFIGDVDTVMQGARSSFVTGSLIFGFFVKFNGD